MFNILADIGFRWGGRGGGDCLCVSGVIFGRAAGGGEGEGTGTEVDASKILYLRCVLNADRCAIVDRRNVVFE